LRERLPTVCLLFQSGCCCTSAKAEFHSELAFRRQRFSWPPSDRSAKSRQWCFVDLTPVARGLDKSTGLP
jgi:hypothetical protein